MKNWLVKRSGKCLGHFIADDLVLKDGTLFARRGGRIIGAVASGTNLSWHSAPLY